MEKRFNKKGQLVILRTEEGKHYVGLLLGKEKDYMIYWSDFDQVIGHAKNRENEQNLTFTNFFAKFNDDTKVHLNILNSIVSSIIR